MVAPVVDQRLLLYPAGVHAAEEIFLDLSKRVDITPRSFPSGWLFDSDRLESLFASEPLALIVPTSLRLDRQLLERVEGRCSLFASVSTGRDHIDAVALEEFGGSFFHAPGANAWSVVEYLIASLPHFFDEERLCSGQLFIAIIGYGHIGRRLGLLLDALAIEWGWYDPLLGSDSLAALTAAAVSRRLELATLLGRADLVTFHVPLTKSGAHATFGMVDDDYLDAIASGAVLFNASRGQIFSQQSYYRAVKHHAAWMDVFFEEPPPNNSLIDVRLVSPHIAGYNYSARVEGCARVAEQIAAYLGVSRFRALRPQPTAELHVLEAPLVESQLLKGAPQSFQNRRLYYPIRADLAQLQSSSHELAQVAASPFLQRLFAVNLAGL